MRRSQNSHNGPSRSPYSCCAILVQHGTMTTGGDWPQASGGCCRAVGRQDRRRCVGRSMWQDTAANSPIIAQRVVAMLAVEQRKVVKQHHVVGTVLWSLGYGPGRHQNVAKGTTSRDKPSAQPCARRRAAAACWPCSRRTSARVHKRKWRPLLPPQHLRPRSAGVSVRCWM
jgi:hypothetical protein